MKKYQKKHKNNNFYINYKIEKHKQLQMLSKSSNIGRFQGNSLDMDRFHC